MSFFGDVLSFENFKLGNMWDKIKKNPEQLLLGAADPFSAKLWGGITGKEYSPLVDQWGGATKDDYAKAEAAGINTGAGKTMHGLAKTIAGLYAGGYGMKQMPSSGGSGGLLDFSGTQQAAPITDLSTPASSQALQGMNTGAAAGKGGGLMGYVKPVGEAMGAAQSAKGLLGSSETPQPPPQVQSSPLDLSGVLNANQQEQARQLEEDMRRRQSLNDFAAYAMKGGR